MGCGTAVRLVGALVLALLVQTNILKECAAPSSSSFPQLATDSVDVLPRDQSSSRLKKLFAKARAGTKSSIRFTEFPDDGLKTTSAIEKATEGYVLALRAGMNHDLRENSIAHELTHVVLQGNGFAADIHTPDGVSPMMRILGFAITSCVDDAVVDRRMALSGFRPELVNRDSAERLRRNRSMATTPSLKEPIYRDGSALLIVCFSFRKRYRGDEIESTWAQISSEIVGRARELAAEIGDITCDNASSCFQKKKHVRDVLGYPITFCDPSTGKLE
jgi:hypothetical protein